MTLWVLVGTVKVGSGNTSVNAGKRVPFAYADELKLDKSSACVLLAGSSPRALVCSNDAANPKVKVVSLHSGGTSGNKPVDGSRSKKSPGKLTLEFRKVTSRSKSGAAKDKRYGFKATIKL